MRICPRQIGLRWLIGAVCLLGLPLPSAMAQRFGDIDVSVVPLPDLETRSSETLGGYVEFRIVLQNFSASQDHRVRLNYPFASMPSYGDQSLARDSRTVDVARGSKSVFSIFKPPVPVPGQNMSLEIDGVRQERAVGLSADFLDSTYSSYRYSSSSGSRDSLFVLASRDIPQDFKDAVRTATHDSTIFLRSELVAGEWSRNWLGYTCYDIVLVTEQEAAAMPAEVLLALRQYVEVGGIVLVRGATAGSNPAIPVALREPGPASREDGAYHIGFGLTRVCPHFSDWPSEFSAARSFGKNMPADKAMRVRGEFTVPVRGLLIVVIVFAIAIGPVNIWLLSRRQRRMWLWWNVPAVSLLTCLAVLGYSLFAEGWTGRGRAAVLTLLDENVHRATTLGYVSFYCPLTPADGLHFSYDTEVTPLAAENNTDYYHRREGRSVTINWTSDQHFDTGWVAPRSPAFFAVRKSETRRERLAIRQDGDGRVTVVNGLGADIDRLCYVDRAGIMHTAVDVPAGQEKALKQGGSLDALKIELTGQPRTLRTLYKQSWAKSIGDLKEKPERFLAPGRYIAVVKNSPFMESALHDGNDDGSWGIVYGISATPEHAVPANAAPDGGKPKGGKAGDEH